MSWPSTLTRRSAQSNGKSAPTALRTLSRSRTTGTFSPCTSTVMLRVSARAEPARRRREAVMASLFMSFLSVRLLEESGDDVAGLLGGAPERGGRLAGAVDDAGLVLAADGGEDLDQVGRVVHAARALVLVQEGQQVGSRLERVAEERVVRHADAVGDLAGDLHEARVVLGRQDELDELPGLLGVIGRGEDGD